MFKKDAELLSVLVRKIIFVLCHGTAQMLRDCNGNQFAHSESFLAHALQLPLFLPGIEGTHFGKIWWDFWLWNKWKRSCWIVHSVKKFRLPFEKFWWLEFFGNSKTEFIDHAGNIFFFPTTFCHLFCLRETTWKMTNHWKVVWLLKMWDTRTFVSVKVIWVTFGLWWDNEADVLSVNPSRQNECANKNV